MHSNSNWLSSFRHGWVLSWTNHAGIFSPCSHGEQSKPMAAEGFSWKVHLVGAVGKDKLSYNVFFICSEFGQDSGSGNQHIPDTQTGLLSSSLKSTPKLSNDVWGDILQIREMEDGELLGKRCKEMSILSDTFQNEQIQKLVTGSSQKEE